MTAAPNRIERLAATVEQFAAKDEFIIFAVSFVTDEEIAMLRRYQDYIEWLGKDTDYPAPEGQLTTREKMLIGWYRQQPKADQVVLIAIVRFLNTIDDLWNAKAGAK